MFEIKPSEYRDYENVDSHEIGYGPELVNSRVSEHEAENGQRIGVFVTEPLEGAGATVIMPAQHEYRNEPLVMRRAEIMATQMQARIAVVEMPGTTGLVYPDAGKDQGYSVYTAEKSLGKAARQTGRQLRSAAKGDFSEHAGIQLDAAVSAMNLTEKDRLVLFGESMGSVTATEMVSHIGRRGLQLDSIVLHEAANASNDNSLLWLTSILGKLGGVESARRDQYFDENAVIGHPIRAFEQTSESYKKIDAARKNPTQQFFGGIANGLGMRKGIESKLLDSLEGFGKQAPEIILSRGMDSQVSDALAYRKLSDALAENGYTVRGWEHSDTSEQQEIGHFFVMSLGRQAVYAKQLAEALNS